MDENKYSTPERDASGRLRSSHWLTWLEIIVGATFYMGFLGCVGPPQYRVVHFVIPDGFRGPFVIVESSDGQELTERGGITQMHITDGRVVKVKSIAVFRELRQRRASYASGGNIPVFDVRDDQIALRSNGLNSRDGGPEQLELFVGTEQEFRNCDFAKLNE
jgi:hypothetical protein